MAEAVPQVNDAVVFVSGEPFGVVVSSRPGGFRVRSETQEVWLSRSSVFTRGHRQVTLICSVEGLPRYQLSGTSR